MEKVTIIGIGLAKRSFQLHVQHIPHNIACRFIPAEHNQRSGE